MLRLVSATYISLLTICLLTETVSGESTESVESFINLESEISSTQKDTKIRIAKAWTALNNMDTMWKSVRATVESVQLWQVHTPLSDFLKKLLVQRNTKINKKLNGVITFPWRLRLQ